MLLCVQYIRQKQEAMTIVDKSPQAEIKTCYNSFDSKNGKRKIEIRKNSVISRLLKSDFIKQ